MPTINSSCPSFFFFFLYLWVKIERGKQETIVRRKRDVARDK